MRTQRTARSPRAKGEGPPRLTARPTELFGCTAGGLRLLAVGASLVACGDLRGDAPPAAPSVAPVSSLPRPPAERDDAYWDAAGRPRDLPLCDPRSDLSIETRIRSCDVATSEEGARGWPRTSLGRLDPSHVREVIRARYPEIRACYEALLKTAPGVEGKVTTRFVIALDGRVTSTVIASDEIGDAAMARCVRAVFAAMRFRVPTGGPVTVTYPIAFQSDAP